jgi:hypothetical protein
MAYELREGCGTSFNNKFKEKDTQLSRTYREATGVEFGKGASHEKYPWKGVFGVCILIFFSLFICEKL